MEQALDFYYNNSYSEVEIEAVAAPPASKSQKIETSKKPTIFIFL